ncbi:MAG: FHA domain-containing protein [Armatimonadetes bacterium]|nr:FHA domain-containing protein [Armatimonadota bacterium]
MKIKLEVLGGPMDGLDFNFEKNIKIGRDKNNDFILPLDKFISRNHAQIKVKDGKYYIEDLKSANGTFINEKQISEETMLSEGEIFKLGQTALRISWEI